MLLEAKSAFSPRGRTQAASARRRDGVGNRATRSGVHCDRGSAGGLIDAGGVERRRNWSHLRDHQGMADQPELDNAQRWPDHVQYRQQR
jgi:hypothetical protein